MVLGRKKLAILLVLIAAASYWLSQELGQDDVARLKKLAHHPDYYMENFTTLNMDAEGQPKNRLHARYMAHYPDDDTNELHEPELEIYKPNRQPIVVSADKGWVTSNNEVILLSGNVYLYQHDEFGELKTELIAEDARILVDQEYAETDNPATLISGRMVTNAVGMRAYLQEQRLEFLSNVQTTIEPKTVP